MKPKIGVGFRIGKLTVSEPTGERKNGYTVWNCACDCGGLIRLTRIHKETENEAAILLRFQSLFLLLNNVTHKIPRTTSSYWVMSWGFLTF